MGDLKNIPLCNRSIGPKILLKRSKMRTKQGKDFVSLLYAKQILMQKKINIDTQFLGRAEARFQEEKKEVFRTVHRE